MVLYKLGCFFATCWNKIVMKISKISYGRHFSSYGRIIFRNYASQNGIEFGDRVYVNSFDGTGNPGTFTGRTLLTASQSGHIRIGNDTKLTNCVLYSASGIEIGNNVTICAGCKIFDTDFHSVKAEYRLNGNKYVPTSPVIIADNVFIGCSVTVLKGVTIGRDSVVGAGSVVTKNIPPREIWAGNPAHFIKKLP